MKRALGTIGTVAVGTLVLGLALPLLALQTELATRPELAVRTRRLHTHAGRLVASAPVGQSFLCRADGLHRIDVRAVAPLTLDAGPVELRVRLDAVDGAIERRVALAASEASGQWLEFRFEPLAGCAGREVFFELLPAGGEPLHPLRPFFRPRAQLDEARPWGSDTATATTATLELRSAMPDLSMLAVAMERVEPDARLELRLYAAGDDDGPEEGEPLRRSALDGLDVVEGYVLFPFEPIAASYARTYRAELALPATATARLAGGELSAHAYHGAHAVDPALGGATLGGRRFADRDLAFRAWTRAGLGDTLARLHAELGARLIAAVLLWLACVALVLRLVLERAAAEDTRLVGMDSSVTRR